MSKTMFEECCDEIEEGGLSILSDRAKQRIKDLIRRCLQDAYDRGANDVRRGNSVSK